MQLFKRECNKHPLKPKYPEYKEWVDATVTVLHPAEVGVSEEKIPIEGLNERQKKALEYIRQHSYMTRKDYQRINEIGKVMAVRELNQLIDRKIIQKSGKGKTTRYIVNE